MLDQPLQRQTVPELLAQYAAILAELHRRRVVRSRNAPVGDYAETLAAHVYDGQLAAKSQKSFDVTAADGRLVQVKARTVGPGVRTAAKFSPFRSFDFDIAVFVAFDLSSYAVTWAREVAAAAIRDEVSYSAHVNGSTVRIRSAERLGEDVTERFRAAQGPAH